MAERDFLTEAFNDCIDRLRGGASLDDCLRRYPQYAGELRPMLFSVEAVRRAQPLAGEAAQAQMNARFRFEAVLQQQHRRRSVPVFFRYLAAAVALVVITSGILVAASQNALPGDPLYGVKRAGEQALMALAGGGNEDGRLNDRRVEEVNALLAAGRTEDVSFDGEVMAQNGVEWQVGGLPVRLADEVEGAEGILVRDRVRVFAFTTPNGQLIAHRLLLLERGLTLTPTPPPTLSATATEPPSPTATVPPTETASATLTPTLTASPTAAPTLTRTATLTATQTSSPTRTPSATRTPSRTPTPLPVACVPAAPPGWVTYRVQPGDTLSGLAAATGTTLESVLAANCLTLQSVLIAGQPLFLARLPATQAAPVQPPPAQPTDDSGNSGSGSDDSGDDSGDDHSGSDNSGSGNSGGGGSDD